MERSSGVLLHPTSLWGRFGIGDLGPAAIEWIDWLAGTGCGLWQILPLGPTGYGDSPYQTFSSFAGNTYLLSPTRLVEDGFLIADDLEDVPDFPADSVEFGPVIAWKERMLDIAYERYRDGLEAGWGTEVAAWRSSQEAWLEDYALFRALKDHHGGAQWTEWDLALRLRDSEALDNAKRDFVDKIDRHVLGQFLFFRQWDVVRSAAQAAGLRIVGDLPIFVAADSADVWARQELFELDDNGLPTVVAGVPPDYFSATGQLWGNPLYDWQAHAADGFAWWKARLHAVLSMVDVVRIDHFRGFANYWEIPAGAPTAETGKWVEGPGDAFFGAIRDEFGDLPIVAEDLGELHDIVPQLRDRWGLPGMRVLQFAFDGQPDNPFLPHNYVEHTVAYTGTHDNDTTLGWWSTAGDEERSQALTYMGSDDSNVAWSMIATVWHSKAVYAVAPLQDFLQLGSEARMNTPGEPAGNWTWRVGRDQLTDVIARTLNSLNQESGRT